MQFVLNFVALCLLLFSIESQISCKLIQNLFSTTFIAISKVLFHHTTATLTSLIFEFEQIANLGRVNFFQ